MTNSDLKMRKIKCRKLFDCQRFLKELCQISWIIIMWIWNSYFYEVFLVQNLKIGLSLRKYENHIIMEKIRKSYYHRENMKIVLSWRKYENRILKIHWYKLRRIFCRDRIFSMIIRFSYFRHDNMIFVFI